jgi:N-acetylglutamate synthase-like GNAT family acetyltransferase
MNKSERNFKIRPAELEDQKVIRSLLWEYKLPLEGLEDTTLWALQLSSGEVVGTAGLEIYGSQGLLRSVAVIKNKCNQGYGTALVAYVIGEAKKRHMRNLFLLTTTAPEFFRKLGFKEESREKVVGGIVDSAEFKSTCPKTAVLMHLSLA